MTMAEAICCTLVNCNCDSFKPGKLKRRQCENCKHGWVAHALSKLKVHHMYQSSQVEIVHSNVVFDICSLMLYGTQAIPVRLKILLDRLFSVLKQDEVIHILNALDWTLQDYIRGYVLQDVAGKVLDRWAIMTFEEEIATLQQFLRFGETKSIVELMALQDKEGQAVLVPSTRTNSDIRTFIERSTPRNPANLLTPKIEKLSNNNNSNVHHFENFINSMAFMLPFQLLGSVPAPLLGSAPGPPQQVQQPSSQQQHPPQMEPQGPKRDEQGHRDAQGRDGLVSLPHPPTENSLLGSSSASFTSDLDRGDNGIDGLSITTKMEVEDFPTSDNYSDGPSTPCTPSMSSEVMQMSPETKLRCLDRNGGGMGSGLKKGRVYCSACEKTFYDKGTLKIHYNAVHLKIKHKCTIDGCNMVFSSLRSRNRHSANPNPRLHMPMNRNNRDKDLRGGNLSADEGSESDRRSEYGTPVPVSSSSAESHKAVPSYMVSHVDAGSKLHGSSFPSMGQSGILFPNLKTVQPVLPFYRSLVTPAELANTPGTLPSLPLLSSSVPLKPVASATTTVESCGAAESPVPKKKSRKSSMPIKIEKEAVERDEGMEPGSSSEDEAVERLRDREAYDGKRAGGHTCSRLAPEERDREDHSVVRELLAREKAGVEEEDRETQQRRRVETGVITCASSPYDSNKLHHDGDSLKRGREHADRRSLFREPAESDEAGERECVNPLHAVANKPCGDLDREEEEEEEGAECRVTANGVVALCPSEGRERGDGGTEQDRAAGEYGDGGLSHLDPEADLPHHCEICSKTFKNPYSVKMHYRNVHLKEMHMCTVDGCNAAFPSRRSRDRHSSNLNLHHKLLTRDTYSPVYSPLSHCRDGRDNFLGLDFCPEQQQRENNNNSNRELPHRDSTTQTSVIFRGARNRMGLVYPMSKTADAPPANADAAGMEGAAAGEREGGGGGEDGAVLDLSTSASAPPRNVRSSWDSDGAGSEEGEGLEEDEEEEEEDGEAHLLPMDDSDDSCDGLGGVVGGRPGGQELGLAAGAERTLLSCGGVVGGGGGGQGAVGSGSPITCHVCQKVYSNKGTFRAHYKTVHLRLLHKCKVPGCDTSFSSVRSRNRHSQNPNLHRNLAVSSGTSLDHD